MAGANDGHVDRAEGGLDGALGIHGFGPHRETHIGEFTGIAHAAVDDETLHAAGLARLGQQIAEEPVGVVGGAADDEQVAWLAQFDGHMNHPVVAGLHEHGHGAAGDAGTGINGAHEGAQQTDAALGFMHGGDAELSETGDGLLRRAFDVADGDGFHE